MNKIFTNKIFPHKIFFLLINYFVGRSTRSWPLFLVLLSITPFIFTACGLKALPEIPSAEPAFDAYLQQLKPNATAKVKPQPTPSALANHPSALTAPPTSPSLPPN